MPMNISIIDIKEEIRQWQRAQENIVSIVEKEYTRTGMLKHLQSCKKRMEVCENSEKMSAYYELMLYGTYNKDYWLIIQIKVMLVEALPTLVSNFTIMMINMLNTSAMAGAVGAGGLGAVALTYGYQRFDYLIMYFIVIILIFLVMLIQGIGNKLYKLTK